MKKILTFILLLIGFTSYSQTIGYLRYDTVKMAKNGGTTELILENATKAVTGGVLTNTGNGRTAFVAPSAGAFDWHVIGNAGTNPATNFIGTTDAQDLVIKTDGTEVARFSSDGFYRFSTGTSTTSGEGSVAFGNSTATNTFSFSMGEGSASGGYSVALGNSSAIGDFSSALGRFNKSKSYGGTVVGLWNDSTNAASLVVDNSLNRLFQIGNGTADNARSNAMTVLANGKVGIGVLVPDSTLHIVGGLKYANGSQGAGKVLGSDANGGASWVAASTGTVTGTGTTNYVPKWTSSTALANSQIFDNGTNVGINTATPLTKFNVVETLTTSPRGILSSQFSTSTDGARVGFSKARGTQASPTTVVTGDILGRLMFRGYDGANALEMGSIETGVSGTVAATRVPTYMAFSTATDAAPSVLTERMRILNNGNVGIGTATPLNTLHVIGATSAGGITIGSTATSFNRLTFETASSIGGVINRSASFINSVLYFGESGDGGNYEFRGTGFLTSQGSVGIGTTSPNSTVHANGSFATAYSTKAVNYTTTISDHTIEVTATGVTITLPTAVGITGRMYIVKLTAVGSGTVATTSSQTIDGSTTYSLASQYKYLRVQSNGSNWIIITNN